MAASMPRYATCGIDPVAGAPQPMKSLFRV